MDSRPNSVSPDLSRPGLDNQQLREAQKWEERKREAAKKGSEARTVVAALVQASKDNLAIKAEQEPAYARASWRTPQSDPKVYLSPDYVGWAVKWFWLQGREDKATAVLRRAIDDVANGPQSVSVHERTQKEHLESLRVEQLADDLESLRVEQLADLKSLRVKQLADLESLRVQQLADDEKYARNLQLRPERPQRPIRPPALLAPDRLGGSARRRYPSQRSIRTD